MSVNCSVEHRRIVHCSSAYNDHNNWSCQQKPDNNFKWTLRHSPVIFNILQHPGVKDQHLASRCEPSESDFLN